MTLGIATKAPRARATLRLAAAAAALALCAACREPYRAAPAEPAATVNRVHEVHVPREALGPGEVTVRAEITAPSGRRVSVRAFPRAGGAAVRFRPEEPGLHRWRIVAGGGTVGREVARGLVQAADVGVPGQVRVRGGALVDGAGRPFRPLGENRFNVYDPAWSDGLSTEAYVGRMATDGMNTLRVFVFTACGRPGGPSSPGCLEPAVGRFDEEAARRYDAIFEAAERHGVKVILSIFAIGFTPGDAWKGWEENPYAAERGGPAPSAVEFFVDGGAREAARRRLRYVLARWGASPALLAVDLLNEPEWDGGIPESDWIPWAEDLARTWHAEDPYGHPVTAGPVGLHWDVEHDERPWWRSEGCDIVQWHRYGPDVYDVHALAKDLVGRVRDTARYGKPVLLGEFGWGGEPAPLHDHTHVGIWAATFAGAGVLAHSAPPFTVDSDSPMSPSRARHFRTLARFLRRAEAAEPLAPARDPLVSLPGARALALAGERTVALWLHAPEAGYGARVAGARVSLRGLAPGRWRATWVDDTTGIDVTTAHVEVDRGDATLDVPGFSRHVAALVERVEPERKVQARGAQ
jgi:hypothetical protein